MKHLYIITGLFMAATLYAFSANEDLEALKREFEQKKEELRQLKGQILLLEAEERMKAIREKERKVRDKVRKARKPLAQIKGDPATHFLKAWLYCRSADEGEPAERQANLDKAIQMMRDITRANPKWKPHLIEQRLKWALNAKEEINK